MRTAALERHVLVSVVALLIGLGLWMQLGILSPEKIHDAAADRHEPDYVVENFLARGRDGSGTAYVLRGDYLEHFPDDSTVDIKRPCLLLFEREVSPRLIFADKGRVIENGTMIVLEGNVEVREGLPKNIEESVFLPRGASSACFSPDTLDGTWTRTDELVLRLKPGLER
jgi:LPS export ABC transporter protein LptC